MLATHWKWSETEYRKRACLPRTPIADLADRYEKEHPATSWIASVKLPTQQQNVLKDERLILAEEKREQKLEEALESLLTVTV